MNINVIGSPNRAVTTLTSQPHTLIANSLCGHPLTGGDTKITVASRTPTVWTTTLFATIAVPSDLFFIFHGKWSEFNRAVLDTID